MDGVVDGWMDAWMDGWMDGLVGDSFKEGGTRNLWEMKCVLTILTEASKLKG